MSKKENENKSGENKDSIEEYGAVETKNAGDSIHCLTIIGQIEGHYILPEGAKATKYEHIIPLLVSIEQDLPLQK